LVQRNFADVKSTALTAVEGFPTLFPPVQSEGEMGEKEGKVSYLFTCKKGKRREIMGVNFFPRFSLEKSREPLDSSESLWQKSSAISYFSAFLF